MVWGYIFITLYYKGELSIFYFFYWSVIMNNYTYNTEINITLATLFIAGVILIIMSLTNRRKVKKQISSELGLAIAINKYDVVRIAQQQRSLMESVLLMEEQEDEVITKPVITVKYDHYWKSRANQI